VITERECRKFLKTRTMTKIRMTRLVKFAALLLTSGMLTPPGYAHELPRPELGCRVFDAEGIPLGPADQTFHDRLQVTRCMNTAEREKEWQSRMEKDQLQTMENTRTLRRLAAALSATRVGAVGMPGNPYLPRTGAPNILLPQKER
jgi:hypothetical protein